MKHIDDGTLRRFVDEPFAASDSQRRHFEGCDRCRSAYARMSDTAAATSALFAVAGAPTNTATALMQTRQRLAEDRSSATRPGIRLPARGRRFTASAGAAALLAGALVWSPAGSWAANLMTVFQPTQVGSIDVSGADLQNLSGLAQYGTLTGPSSGAVRQSQSASDAAAALGMPLAEPSSLPAAASGQLVYEISPAQSASFTFSAAKAKAADPSGPAMPASIDGSTLRISLSPAVATVYLQIRHLPNLVIGEMRAPTVTSSGASVAELENYVLNLPDVPRSVADQIRALQDPTSTLPIPIPIDRAHSSDVTVQGVHGVAVGDNTGLGSGVIWERHGVIYGVAGMYSQDQILAMANSLQ